MIQIGKAMGITRSIGRACTVIMVLLSLVTMTQPAKATPLDLTLKPFPDMFSDAIDVNYDAATQTLSASGFAEHILLETDSTTSIVNGLFEVRAQVSTTGAISSGTLTITGEVPSLGIGPGQLLTGELSALGYSSEGGAMEFQFNTNGGSLSFQFGPLINVILGQNGFTGSFAQNFSNQSIGVAGIGW